MAFFDFLKDRTRISTAVGLPAHEKIKAELVEDEYKHFSVEFYPYSDRYFPKWKKMYLGINNRTGVVFALEDRDSVRTQHFYSENDAWTLIDLAILQERTETVVQIKTHPLRRK